MLIVLLAFLLRKPLIENPLVKMYSEQLLNVPTLTEQMLKRGERDEQIRRLAETLAQELDDYDEEEGGEI